MSNPCFYAPQGLFAGSAFRTNALGLERERASAAVAATRACGPVRGPRIGCGDCGMLCAGCDGTTSTPRAYEAGCLAGCLAYPRDGMAGQPLFTVRLTRSAGTAHGAFAIGTALVVATGDAEGVLVRIAADGCTVGVGGVQPDAGPYPTVPLVSTAPDGSVARLTCPRALLVEARRIVVVGSGVYLPGASAGDDALPVSGPAIAVVALSAFGGNGGGSGCDGAVTVTIGNGDTSVTDEEYNDIQSDPVCATAAVWCEDAAAVAAARCRRRAPAASAFVAHGPGQGSFVSVPAATWLVAGSAVVPGDEGGGTRTAVVRRIVTSTMLAMATAILDLAADGAPGPAPAATSAVSLATLSCNGMLVAGVQVFETSSGDVAAGRASAALLWPIKLADLTTVLPWSATRYNTVDTTRLPLTGSMSAVTLLRVLALPAGQVYVACVGTTDPGGVLPAHGAQVYKYRPDTTLDLGYGVGGISTWFEYSACGTALSTRPNDAVLAPGGSGTVLVTGNSFALELDADADTSPAFTYLVPCFPYLDVRVPSMAGSADCPLLPMPFVAAFGDCAAGACGSNSGGAGCGGCSGSGCCGDASGDDCVVACANMGAGRVTAILTAACLCGSCAPLHFATSTAPYAPNGCLVLGDSCFHVGSPSQSANVFAVNLALTAPARVLNASRVAVQTISSCCSGSCGTVLVDALCARGTTLQVHGPVVVGSSAAASGCGLAPTMPLPGTIQFNPATATFEGFTGTAWVVLGGGN